MNTETGPARLALDRLDREIAARLSGFWENLEFDNLSRRLRRLRQRLFADDRIDAAELERLYEELDDAALRWGELAASRGITVGADIEPSRAAFRTYAENAEIHFEYLAGDNRANYRGGLLAEWIQGRNPEAVTRMIALDVVTSASPAIAAEKARLVRAQATLVDDEARRKELLALFAEAVAEEAESAVWKESGRSPAITAADLERIWRFSSLVVAALTQLPHEIVGTNQMLPNRPLAGWETENRRAVRALLNTLSTTGEFFLDQVKPGLDAYQVAMKLELNLGFGGPPSISDPAVTGAVLHELMERSHVKGVRLRFTVGDSNGIENAPVGRNALDIMREGGHYHHALKTALSWVRDREEDEERRSTAGRLLGIIASLEESVPSAFFGSPGDQVSSPDDQAEAERLAAPYVRCVDYDEEGFIPVKPDLGPLGLAVWGTRDFRIAKPWVEADYRVHVTRGVSNHLFAGWTGGMKGLIGLHALGLRPADQGMNQRGESPLDVLLGVMHMSGVWGLMARRAGVRDDSDLFRNEAIRESFERASAKWGLLRERAELKAGWLLWEKKTWELDKELRDELRNGITEVDVMTHMRFRSRAILAEAERLSPGFRAAMWAAVEQGTRDFLVTTWKIRNVLPPEMRDDRMGLRIGLLTQLPYRADLVVQGLPKIGLGGGPDAYENVREAGVIVAGTDEIATDLVALQRARVPGNPWAYNHPIHGALQFGRGPAFWDEIRVIEAPEAGATG